MQWPQSERYDPGEAEPRIREFWEKENVYRFDEHAKGEIYSIDTPPPTVSGSMHIGHAFSYAQQDFIARFQRMRGRNVFYPFGTDDNGLATERLIEKMKNVSSRKMARDEFIALCLKTLDEIRPDFIQDWKNIGTSADFSIFYSTINGHCRRISQRSFVELHKKGRIYRDFRPVIFCPSCRTAIAQVEMQDARLKSTLNYLKAKAEDGSFLVYATTRPEVMYGCVGMSIRQDGNYARIRVGEEAWVTSKDSLPFFGKHVKFTIEKELKGKDLIGLRVAIPIAGNMVRVSHDEVTETGYGTGIVYYCTYGGVDCIEWMARHPEARPIHVMGADGRYNENSGRYKGMGSSEARKAALEDLEKGGFLIHKEPIEHAVNVHERCGTEIEYVATDQWFIRYLDLREEFLKQGRKMRWYPEHMRIRYENWIHGLRWDWNISRQRHFGIPIPAWYCKKCSEVAVAEESQLPVDPLQDRPKKPCPCGSHDFIGEKDVLDTWATSSLTPQLAIELYRDRPVYEKLFPMSLRPQAHDIITFWLFNTVVKSTLHEGSVPWHNIMISGWALDPHGKKMSKSKGNVIAPQEMIKKYSADALRFWAAGSKLGDDMPFQEKDLVTGQKFITKLWNAAKFANIHLSEYTPKKPAKLELADRWILSKLATIISESTETLGQYEYAKTKMEVEKFFWHTICDNYLEVVKDRLYNPDKRGQEAKESAQYALHVSLLGVLKMMAPIMPYITEELYQLYFRQHGKAKSIHLSEWPAPGMKDDEAEKAGDFFVEVLEKVRKAKSERKLSLKATVKSLEIKGAITERLFSDMKEDLMAATGAEKITFSVGKESSVSVGI